MMFIQNRPDPSEYNNFLTDIAHEELKSSIIGEADATRLSKTADAKGSVKACNDIYKAIYISMGSPFCFIRRH